MLLVIARAPLPDMPYWPGRQWLAACDALAWPLAWGFAFSHAPVQVGIVGPVIVAVAVVCGASRLHRALWLNHRYRFTTWRWGRAVAGLILIGIVLRLLLLA